MKSIKKKKERKKNCSFNFTPYLTRSINKLGSKWPNKPAYSCRYLARNGGARARMLCLGFHSNKEIDDVVPRCHISFAYSIPARTLRRTTPCQLLTRLEFVKTLGLTCLLSFYSVVWNVFIGFYGWFHSLSLVTVTAFLPLFCDFLCFCSFSGQRFFFIIIILSF